ncbi:MAG: hypothetical protein ACK55I_07455, partial [bacterium]
MRAIVVRCPCCLSALVGLGTFHRRPVRKPPHQVGKEVRQEVLGIAPEPFLRRRIPVGIPGRKLHLAIVGVAVGQVERQLADADRRRSASAVGNEHVPAELLDPRRLR